MKNNIIIALFATFLLCGCDEEFVGQYPIDNVAPKQVTQIQVDNLPGRVVLNYQLPNETDLLYVKAVYVDAQNVKKEVKASNFKNQLEIVGFGLSKKQTIQLYTVDRSQNESEPLNVEIEPLDSPIYETFKNLEAIESWGGVKFKWENPEKQEIVLEIMMMDDEGIYRSFDAFYSSAPMETRAIRGLDSIPYNLACYIRDAYGNYTDTVKMVRKPLFEMELPGKEFVECSLGTGYKLSVWGHPFNKMFDRLVGSLNKDDPNYYIDPSGSPHPYFTFDMKKVYKFSRFKIWSRSKYPYTLHNPKDYEIWGTDREDADLYPDSWEGWEKLTECHEYIPSGNEYPNITSDDKTHFASGQEYEFPDNVKPVRFVRFRCLENWSGSNGLHIAELRFWGKEVN